MYDEDVLVDDEDILVDGLEVVRIVSRRICRGTDGTYAIDRGSFNDLVYGRRDFVALVKLV